MKIKYKILFSIFLLFIWIRGAFAWDINNYSFTQQHNIWTVNCDQIQLSYSYDGSFWSFLNYALRTGGCAGNTSYWKNLSTNWYINNISSTQNTYIWYSFARVFDWFDEGNYYVRGRYYSWAGLQVHSCTTPYDSTTCTQIYSVWLTSTHLRGSASNYYDASIYDNWNRLYIYVNSWIDEYILSTPYDVSTLTLYRSYNVWGITGFKLTDDGSALFYNIWDTLYVYGLTTPFDLTDTLTSLWNRVFITWGHAFDIDDDGTHLIYSYKGNTTQADYVQAFENSDGGITSWPPELWTGTIDDVRSTADWVEVDFTCDQACNYTIEVRKTDNTLLTYETSTTGTGGSFTGTVNIPVSLQYQGTYNIESIFEDYYDPLIYFIPPTYQFTYWYNPDPESFTIWDYIFSPFGFESIWNGFEVTDLDVDPSVWYFNFYITGPNGTGTGFADYDHTVTSDMYGSGTIQQVTYPYHRFAWNYNLQIQFRNTEEGVWYYPYGTWGINYVVDNPEWAEDESLLYLCDTNGDGFVDSTEYGTCTPNLEGNFFENIYEFFGKIKNFFRAIMEIWNVEPEEWGFFELVPTTHANSWALIEFASLDTTEENILTDIYQFLKGFIIFAFLTLWVILVLVILKKE